MTRRRFPFQFIGNDVVLDFVNTRIVAGTQAIDLIEGTDQLENWMKEAGIQTAIDTWAPAEIARLHLLRDAIQNILQAVIEKHAPDVGALDRINAHLGHYTMHPRLYYDGTTFHIEDEQTHLNPDATMSYLANRTATLLASTDQERIKACAGPQCVLVFKDTSKSGRRKWCSMEACGNRTKAAKFREKPSV